jgi:hypothetical protein
MESCLVVEPASALGAAAIETLLQTGNIATSDECVHSYLLAGKDPGTFT